jgi:hypothetical protein
MCRQRFGLAKNSKKTHLALGSTAFWRMAVDVGGNAPGLQESKMINERLGVGLLSVFAACCLAPAPALAGTAYYAIVSGVGADAAGCGQPAAPCRTFQYAFTNIVAPGGEIRIKDAAGYQPINITHAITIINDGGGDGGLTAVGANPAITINAGPTDVVILKGLSIVGYENGTTVGIKIMKAYNVLIDDCTIHNVTSSANVLQDGIGILIVPQLSISSVTISNSIISGNQTGILAAGTPSLPLNLVIKNSKLTGNIVQAMYASGGGAIMFDNSDISGNNTGLYNFSATIDISASTFVGNQVAIYAPGGSTNSYGDNLFSHNQEDVATQGGGTFNTISKK